MRKGAAGVEGMALHTCTCPPCFTEYLKDGKMECVPKCDLATCDAATGICTGGLGGGSGARAHTLPACMRLAAALHSCSEQTAVLAYCLKM